LGEIESECRVFEWSRVFEKRERKEKDWSAETRYLVGCQRKKKEPSK
jgi:hypothetical protein